MVLASAVPQTNPALTILNAARLRFTSLQADANTITLIGRMISVAFKHARFNRFGDTIQWSAACVFEAASVRRITSDEFDLPRTDVVNDDAIAPIELF